MKRKKILDAAAIAFSRKGFHQTRMDEIAHMADVAKGTLYYNFSSKSQLFAATVTEGLDRITHQIRQELESDLPFMDHFHQLVTTIVKLYMENSDLARIFFNEITSGMEDEVLAEIEAVRSRFLDFIREILELGQSMGYLKPLNAPLSAVGLIGLVDSLCNHYLNNPEETSREAVVETIVDILSTGLLNPERL